MDRSPLPPNFDYGAVKPAPAGNRPWPPDALLAVTDAFCLGDAWNVRLARFLFVAGPAKHLIAVMFHVLMNDGHQSPEHAVEFDIPLPLELDLNDFAVTNLAQSVVPGIDNDALREEVEIMCGVRV